jgi:hypothetical protein
VNGFQDQEVFFEIVLIVGPQDKRRFLEAMCGGGEGCGGVQEIEISFGLPTIKVFSSDVFFFPRLICERF